MKKSMLLAGLSLFITFNGISQEKKKKKFGLKMPELRIGEKLGGLAGDIMTGKTDNLSTTSPMVSLVSGIYSPATKTSASKYFPDGVVEGSHMATITFMKNDGTGILKIEGEVTCEGEEMEYLGLGSYGFVFNEPLSSEKKISITTETGDKAEYILNPVPEIEILSINGDETFPIIDLKEDFKIKVSHPEGSEGTTIKIGLLAMAAGAKAINNFADFKATADEVVIPKESFSNMEISGKLNTGQFDKGLSYLVVTREKVLEDSEIPENQKSGNGQKPKFNSTAYGSRQVVVKGKQEDGVITEVKFSGKYKDKLAYSIYKPNARTGIPFSRASKFGLASLSVSGRTYKKESESGSNSYTLGGTKYTHTWTKTTTYKFPQLPESYWENVMDLFYKKFEAAMKADFSIDFEEVDKVTSSEHYHNFFAGSEYNTQKGVSKSYRNTLFTTPTSFAEMWANRSSSQSAETPVTMIMKELNLDGLVSVQITFDVGANRDDQIILLPQVNFSIKGVDETKNFNPGTYAEGYITYKEGVPFSEERLKNDPDYLAEVLNVDQVVNNITYLIETIKRKETELGFDKIWSIGE